MSANPQQFARQVLEAFRAAGHYTDKEIGDAGGPSTTTLTKLRRVADEGGSMPEPRGDTLKKIDTAADWPAGGARALWLTGVTPKVNPQALREALGMPPQTPEEKRAARKARDGGGIDSYVEVLADRLLEVEERLDLLAQDVAKLLSDPADIPDLRAVAKEGALEDPGEHSI